MRHLAKIIVMRLSFLHQSGSNYPTYNPPFFRGADHKEYFSHDNRVHGPYNSHEEAITAFQTLLHTLEGVR